MPSSSGQSVEAGSHVHAAIGIHNLSSSTCFPSHAIPQTLHIHKVIESSIEFKIFGPLQLFDEPRHMTNSVI